MQIQRIDYTAFMYLLLGTKFMYGVYCNDDTLYLDCFAFKSKIRSFALLTYIAKQGSEEMPTEGLYLVTF